MAENINIVDVLDHIFAEDAKFKRKWAYEKQIQMSGFPIKKTLDDFDCSFQPSIDKRQIDELAAQYRFSTYYVNCHQLIAQLKKAHFENRLPDKLRVLAKYRILVIDEIGCLPTWTHPGRKSVLSTHCKAV